MSDDVRDGTLDERVLDRTGAAVRAQAAVTRNTAERRRAEAQRLVVETARLHERVARGRRELVFILEEDPELGAALPTDEIETISALLRARTILVEDSEWAAPRLPEAVTFGLLVLDGLIGRRVDVEGAVTLELIGAGDILRPWDERPLERGPQWRVFEPARLAVLDERITRIVGRHAELIVSFSERLLRRVRSAHELNAISHLPRVEERLLAALWHLAATWGRVTPHGVCVPYRLTHEVLGEIVGAARPTVSLAMRTLRDRGEVLRLASGEYVLTGEPPAHYGAD